MQTKAILNVNRREMLQLWMFWSRLEGLGIGFAMHKGYQCQFILLLKSIILLTTVIQKNMSKFFRDGASRENFVWGKARGFCTIFLMFKLFASANFLCIKVKACIKTSEFMLSVWEKRLCHLERHNLLEFLFILDTAIQAFFSSLQSKWDGSVYPRKL